LKNILTKQDMLREGYFKLKVFIGKIKTVLPPVYTPGEVVDKVYPVEKFGEKINKLAHKLAKNIGIKNKPTAIDLDKIPEIQLKRPEDHPLEWGKKLINQLSEDIGLDNIGFLSVSYNITYNRDFLPNLASQLVMETGIKTDIPPEEIAYYGCASGVFSLKSAYEYSKKYKKAAVVYTFDQ
jgi:predicted naringenin-chalcone synthase